MNRRRFIEAFVGGVAAVAIGMRVSKGMPALVDDGFYDHKVVKMGFTITREDIEDGTNYGELGKRVAEALSKSVGEVKDRKARPESTATPSWGRSASML